MIDSLERNKGSERDNSQALLEQIKEAITEDRPVCIEGGGSKSFLGRETVGEPLSTAQHTGIIRYQPQELVLTVRSGTPLTEINQALAEQQQMLAFEPPAYGDQATIGGTVACGLSGPRRPYTGSARDFVLGVTIINGKGETLRFGGEVMKNVAGYDVSRLMVGAYGTLGLILDISFKVLPKPPLDLTLIYECDQAEAISRMNQWAGRALPISATCHINQHLYVRLSGNETAVNAAYQVLGGTRFDTIESDSFWDDLREHRLSFFDPPHSLWRISVPTNTPPLNLAGSWLLEWNGGQRWLVTDAAPTQIREQVAAAGGHASQFRHHDAQSAVFHPLSAPLLQVHQHIKQAFDPLDIFNRQRMYLDI